MLCMYSCICGGIITFLVTIMIYCIFKCMGCCMQLKVKHGALPDSVFFYFDFQTSVRNISNSFRTTGSKLPASVLKIFKKGLCKCFSIYFDNPHILENPNTMRYCCGYSFNTKGLDENIEKELVQAGFLKAELPESKIVYSTFPYRCFLSYMIGAKRVWGFLFENAQSLLKEENFSENHYPCIEINNINYIEYIIPIQNQSKFLISKYPEPKYLKRLIPSIKKLN